MDCPLPIPRSPEPSEAATPLPGGGAARDYVERGGMPESQDECKDIGQTVRRGVAQYLRNGTATTERRIQRRVGNVAIEMVFRATPLCLNSRIASGSD